MHLYNAPAAHRKQEASRAEEEGVLICIDIRVYRICMSYMFIFVLRRRGCRLGRGGRGADWDDFHYMHMTYICMHIHMMEVCERDLNDSRTYL